MANEMSDFYIRDNVRSYEMDENNVITVPTTYVPNEKGFGYQLFKAMLKYRHCIAQYVADTKEQDTYEDLLQRCIRVALHLQEYNLEKNDIIMLCTVNHKNSCVPFIATCFLGLQVASLDPTLSLLEMTHLLKEVQPRIVFLVSEALEVIEQAVSELDLSTDIVVFDGSDKFRSFDDLLEPHEDEETFSPAMVNSLDDPAIIFFSSGTTGLPKGIVINHYSIGAQAHNLILTGNTGPVILYFTSLYWISGVLLLACCLMTGAARVICAHYDPNELWYIIDKYKVSSLVLTPFNAISLVKAGRPDNIDTTSLWSLIIGGGSVAETYIRKLQDLVPGTFVIQVYGQTEVGGTLTTFNTNNVKDTLMLYYKPNSCGTPIPGLAYKVVDIETENSCGPHEHGELRIRSKVVMNGYYNRDSSETFDSDGWLKTGDIVFFDEDYCFYVVDRIKEMLKYKSWHVPPAVIEKILFNHPAVQQVSVIGIPHPEDGDHPMAIIVPADSYKNTITEEEICKYVAEKVPDNLKLRGGVKFLDSLPVTPSGKIKKKTIKDMILRGDI